MPTDWSDNIIIAELADEPQLSEELNAVLQRLDNAKPGHIPHVVLNLSGVTYVNSSNLASLLKLRKRLAEASKLLKLCSVSDEVWSVMLVTGLDKLFRFAPDPMTALAGLQIEDEKGSR